MVTNWYIIQKKTLHGQTLNNIFFEVSLSGGIPNCQASINSSGGIIVTEDVSISIQSRIWMDLFYICCNTPTNINSQHTNGISFCLCQDSKKLERYSIIIKISYWKLNLTHPENIPKNGVRPPQFHKNSIRISTPGHFFDAEVTPEIILYESTTIAALHHESIWRSIGYRNTTKLL